MYFIRWIYHILVYLGTPGSNVVTSQFGQGCCYLGIYGGQVIPRVFTISHFLFFYFLLTFSYYPNHHLSFLLLFSSNFASLAPPVQVQYQINRCRCRCRCGCRYTDNIFASHCVSYLHLPSTCPRLTSTCHRARDLPFCALSTYLPTQIIYFPPSCSTTLSLGLAIFTPFGR